MGRIYYEESGGEFREELIPMDEKNYREPNSLHIAEDWDTMMEDFLDDFDDYQDINFTSSDDDL